MKKIERILAGALVAASASFAVPSSASAMLVIDTFTPGTVALSANSGNIVDSSLEMLLPVTDVIGGAREVSVTWQSGELSATANNNPPIGTLGLSSATGVTALFEMTYDAGGLGLGGLDLTQMGENTGIDVAFIAADAGAATTVTLMDTVGDTLELTLNTAGPGALFFDFDLFAGIGDVTDIDSIHFAIQGQIDGDYQIDLIRAISDVPEPLTATLGTLGLGVLGLGLRRRRIA